jgi:uncharacterized lipoprotein NlpE involved in copper resistance
MNRKAFTIFLLMGAVVICGLSSCLPKRGIVDTHNSKISLDWEGVYTGTIPSASGPGIDVRLKLNMDQSFELTYEYLDRDNEPFNWTGSFQWDDTGNIITLGIEDVPSYYKVAENKLIQLDMEGEPISGELADNYELKKTVD